MNRAIKEASVKRYHDDKHQQFKTHPETLVNAYTYARRLKTLKGPSLTNTSAKYGLPHLNTFRVNPMHKIPGLDLCSEPINFTSAKRFTAPETERDHEQSISTERQLHDHGELLCLFNHLVHVVVPLY